MTSVADQRMNLTRHMDWEHGVRPWTLYSDSLAEVMEKHAVIHRADSDGSRAHLEHLVAVLKGETANINSTQEES